MEDPVIMGSRLTDGLGSHCSFLGLPVTEASFAGAKVAILPVPYDGTTTYRSGTRAGPRAILEASGELEYFDEETGTEPHLHGIATLKELPVTVSSPKDMVVRVQKAGEFILKAGKLPVLLGGEHLLSLGLIRAVCSYYDNITILQLDAHADLRAEYQDSVFSNACVMRQALEYAPLVQVGIRSLTREEHEFITEKRIPCYFAHRIVRNADIWDDVVEHLGPNVYVTIDLDVFDPSIMPAVGTPEPGGLGWWEVLGLLRGVSSRKNIVGFDVMELAPIAQTVAPDFLAARLVHKLLSYIFVDNTPPSC